MEESVWRSLRARIVLLTVVACVFIAVAASSFYRFLRSSHASTIEESQRHLTQVGSDVARAYEQQSVNGVSLLHTPGKPPPPTASIRQKTHIPAPPPPPPPPDDLAGPPALPVEPLSVVTSYALQKEQGIEGGFLSASGQLVGYAFPTHEGPGLQKEMPQRERPTIIRLAREAASVGSQRSFVFEGPHDTVLFYARPVRESVNGKQQVTGAIWLMQRLSDLNRGRNRQLLLAAIGFGSAAIISALLAGFVMVEIRGGVNSITRHLAHLQQDLSHTAGPTERPKLVEFAHVMRGIDSMAASLQSRIANERSLEVELRHKERLSSLGQFAAGVAHELRNPLATIRLRTQMAQAGSKEELVARSSSVILEEVDRLDAMISKLLHFSRPISLDLRLIELCELCSSMIATWQHRTLPTVTFVQRCPTEAVIVADRARLVQVLDNLFENAVQSLRIGGGEISVDVFQVQGSLHLRVADTGGGFTPTALNHAFDPFFTTKDTGTGLGLSIAFELIQALHGEIRAENRFEGGAVVTVILPTEAAGMSA